jgi:hypothetical protein
MHTPCQQEPVSELLEIARREASLRVLVGTDLLTYHDGIMMGS